MKHDARTDEVLSEIRNERIARGFERGADERHRDGTGDVFMLGANAAWKTLQFEAATEGGTSWRAHVNVALAIALTCPPLSLSLRTSLVDLAAMIVAWIEAIDREAL